MIDTLPIAVNDAEVAAFCKRHHITKFAFFGSILTDRFGPESDVDVLVEFDRANIPTLFDVVDMEDELVAMFGRKVDLRTPNELSDYFRDGVLGSARIQYAA